MNLKLTRKELRPDGIFSELRDESGNLVAVTLEHAYQNDSGAWAPKISDGVYTCQRGPHRLHGMTDDFITFEITGVQGHSNLLFHWGNWNDDSEGCVLCGEAITQSAKGQMITNSKTTFAAFIALQDGLDQFQLTVESSSA